MLHISMLFKCNYPQPLSTHTHTVQPLLQQEIEQLRYQIDHHPDVTKFALENLDLRGTHTHGYTAYHAIYIHAL